MGFEPTTLTLARLHSTTELFPRFLPRSYVPYEFFFACGQESYEKKIKHERTTKVLKAQKMVKIGFKPLIGLFKKRIGFFKLSKG